MQPRERGRAACCWLKRCRSGRSESPIVARRDRFPNLVGPIYPGSAILFRVRPNGRDPDSAIQDTWVLEWPAPGTTWRMPERRFFPDWRARNWGEITTPDYENLTRGQAGMRPRGFTRPPPKPRPEGKPL